MQLGVLLTQLRACPRAQVDYRPYELQPLSGLLISATNFVGRVERQHLQDRITAAGATYSAELRKETCSHLVARSLAGPKCKCVLVRQEQHKPVLGQHRQEPEPSSWACRQEQELEQEPEGRRSRRWGRAEEFLRIRTADKEDPAERSPWTWSAT